MQHFLIYEDAAGNCRIIAPKEGFEDFYQKEADVIRRLYELAIPDYVEFVACKPDLIPKDHTFRDAWKKGDKDEPIKIDIPMAFAIHRKRLKEAAERKIELLRRQLEIAIENSNTPEQVSIRATTKIMRTIHLDNLTHCKTSEDIKYAIPKELHEVWTLYPPVKP